MPARRFTIALSLALGATLMFACGSASTTDPDAATSDIDAATAGGDAATPDAATPDADPPDAGWECTPNTRRCVNLDSELCVDGQWVADPCPQDTGCEPTDGSCQQCLCTPGEAVQCADTATLEVCAPSCLELTPTSCASMTACVNAVCEPVICSPNALGCADPQNSQVCNATGTAWISQTACAAKTACVEELGCQTLCEIGALSPSSAGCSFWSLNMDNFSEGPDAVVVTNAHPSESAEVTLYAHATDGTASVVTTATVSPGGSQALVLPSAAANVIESVTEHRAGAAFRIASDLPLQAALHSTYDVSSSTDASLLLPEAALGTEYYIATYRDTLGGYPSYFDVVATEDATVVTIVAGDATLGGTGFGAMMQGGTQMVMLNRSDVLQVRAPNGGDLTGTSVVASAPVAVLGAVECANVPATASYCDHLEEQLLPLSAWGTTYVATQAPRRSQSEAFFWRLMASTDNTVITTAPAQPGSPYTLDAGSWIEFSSTVDFVATSSLPFSVTQYLSGQNYLAVGSGDPAMSTTIPVDRWLASYLLDAVPGYTVNRLQVIRSTADPVNLDGAPISEMAYRTIGAYTVADLEVAAGVHSLTSTAPFGASLSAISLAGSYMHPAGINLAPLALP